MSPLGGTELQYQLLYKYVDNSLLDNFLITTSVPEKIPLSKDKINILWQQNSYDQPNLLIGSQTKIIIISMIFMFLIRIGVMKNLE